MTARHPDILTVRDSEILRLLRRVVGIGEYRKTFTADDVTRVANRWLTPRDAQIVHLRPLPAHEDDAPTIKLPKGQAAAIQALAENPHSSNYDLGLLLGIHPDAAKDRLRRAYMVLGVTSRKAAIELITSGKIRIMTRTSCSRGA